MARAYVEIPLHGKVAAGRVALVSIEKYGLVIRYRWSARKKDGQRRAPKTYAQAWDGTRKRTITMHRLVTGEKWKLVDHGNHDGLDNRDPNLGPATNQQNHWHQRGWANSSSAYRGVSWNKTNRKWRAQITVSGKNKFLGYFTDEIKAARAYDQSAQEHFGSWANLNFP